MTPAERVLWQAVRDNPRFPRQHIIAGFIAGFHCHAARLVGGGKGLISSDEKPHHL
jgi:very-short-patch-repair endonuclease